MRAAKGHQRRGERLTDDAGESTVSEDQKKKKKKKNFREGGAEPARTEGRRASRDPGRAVSRSRRAFV